MLDKTSTTRRDVPFPIEDPEKIPKQRYYDAEFFELEREHLWPHIWQYACRLEEIPDIGDWTEYKILDMSVLVIRTADGVKAFNNACRHRGVRFATGTGNCAHKGFTCPFHGWRWNMDGENIFVFGKHIFNEDLLDQAELNLVPVRVETWGGCAFINFDDDAPSLLESLGPVAQRMDNRHVENLKVEWWVSTVLPTNWKLAMEAFMEGYHVMATHPQLHKTSLPENNYYGDSGGGAAPTEPRNWEEWYDFMIVSRARLSSGMAGMIRPEEIEAMKDLRSEMLELLKDTPYPEPDFAKRRLVYGRLNEEFTRRGRDRNMPIFDLNQVAASQDFNAVEFMFPHYFLLPFWSAMSSYRVRPLTPESCLFEIWSLAFYPEDEERPVPTPPEPIPYDSPDFPEIPAQDYSNLPLQQLGLHDRGFAFMRLSREKEGMISNYHRLIDGYLEGRDVEQLVAAQHIVNNGFDKVIRDIGFGPAWDEKTRSSR